MPKITSEEIVKQEGDGDIAPQSRPSYTFAALPNQGHFNVIINGVKYDTFTTKKGDTMAKLTPDMVIPVNRDDTTRLHRISRHDMVIGYVVNGVIANLDKTETKSPVFSGQTGARFFLQNLGQYSDNGKTYSLSLDTDSIFGMVLKAFFEWQAYCVSDPDMNMNNEQLQQWLAERGVINPHDARGDMSKLTDKDVYAAFETFNAEMGYEEGKGLNLKSIPTFWYALTAEQAEWGKFHFDADSKLTFVNEGAFVAWQQYMEHGGSESTDDTTMF